MHFLVGTAGQMAEQIQWRRSRMVFTYIKSIFGHLRRSWRALPEAERRGGTA
jgi:hypothetical protein